jgi:glucokinase
MTSPGDEVAHDAVRVLAFDVGGTHVRGALCDGSGRLLQREVLPSPRADGPALLSALAQLADSLTESGGPRPCAAGLAIAGLLDLVSGSLLVSPNLELEHVELVAPLSQALDLPVALVNDVNAAALGEASSAGCEHLVALFIGSGVGFGAVTGGHLVEGLRGMAGEAGHLIFDPAGPPCPAGCVGCFDAVLGGHGLARAARAAGVAQDTEGLLAAWRAGDARAGQLVERALSAMSVLTRLAVNLFDPDRVVVGGGLAAHLPELQLAAQQGVSGNPIGSGRGALPVVAAALGDDAGLVGAARRALVAR